MNRQGHSRIKILVVLFLIMNLCACVLFQAPLPVLALIGAADSGDIDDSHLEIARQKGDGELIKLLTHAKRV